MALKVLLLAPQKLGNLLIPFGFSFLSWAINTRRLFLVSRDRNVTIRVIGDEVVGVEMQLIFFSGAITVVT